MTYTKDQREKIDLVFERFVHRRDLYAEQWIDRNDPSRGGWAPRVANHCDQGCTAKRCMHTQYDPLTEVVIARHLSGLDTVGVYQLDTEDTVKWLCFDIDVNKGATVSQMRPFVVEHAKQLRAKIKSLGLPTLIEDSTNKGVHLWVFFSSPVPAKKVHALGGWISQAVPNPENIHTEVFPKQTQHRGSFGNLVRIPFGKHLKSNRFSGFVSPDTFEPLSREEQWKALAMVPTVTEAQLDSILAEHKIEMIVPTTETSKDEYGVNEKTPKCLSKVLREGAEDGYTDVAAFRLACYLRDRGIPQDLATTTLLEWNKRNAEPMDESYVEAKVESGFSHTYSPYPCSEPSFDAICTSSCFWYANKMKARGGKR